MRKRKGLALPGAVALCSFLIVMSFAVSIIVLQTFSNNKINNIYREQKILFAQSHAQFFESKGDKSAITDKSLTYRVYSGEDDIKALCAFVGTRNELRYYAIYDFTVDNEKVLVYQTSNLYLKDIDGISYLGGLVPLGNDYE